jgi:cold-inducible RNA-binding protein
MGRKLYVGNIPFSMGDEALRHLFKKVGTVQSARVARDRASGQARGFAFVEMATDDDALNAILKLNQREIGGRVIVVKAALPKGAITRPRPAGNGADPASEDDEPNGNRR